MKNVALITDVDFWTQGAGHQARIASLIRHLNDHTNLYILYVGRNVNCWGDLKDFYLSDRIFLIFKREEFIINDILCTINKFFHLIQFEVCIIEWIHNSYLLNLIPYPVQSILDTHDLAHRREESFNKFGMRTSRMAERDEYDIFNKYDHVMLICETDYDEAERRLPKQKLILTPHSPILTKRKIRSRVRSIGFIGSDYIPNVDAIKYFLATIWNKFEDDPNLVLNIYGNVGKGLKGDYKNVQLKGFVPNLDSVYNTIDIAINSVRFGAGLKIKNIEAMANGLPLITSSHGARGLERGLGSAFRVADSPNFFIEELNQLINDFSYRERIGHNAYTFVEQNFSASACYSELIATINGSLN